MNKKEYIIRQLGRTKNKVYECYVVTRIIHLLNNFDIKFITQQYVSRPDGRALTDLYFPQFGLHIEVDEGQHYSATNMKRDKLRLADIVDATGHEVLRINATESLESINNEIDKIVDKIKELKNKLKFIPWDIEREFDPQTYIERGYIDIKDDVAFRKIKDACSCFGHNYKACRKAGYKHPDPEILLWFPKLFTNGEWKNSISGDEITIIERNVDEEKAKVHINSILNDKVKNPHKRIVFAKVKGNLGDILYRFRGLYELQTDQSNVKNGLIWKRIDIKVDTYPKKNINNSKI